VFFCHAIGQNPLCRALASVIRNDVEVDESLNHRFEVMHRLRARSPAVVDKSPKGTVYLERKSGEHVVPGVRFCNGMLARLRHNILGGQAYFVRQFEVRY